MIELDVNHDTYCSYEPNIVGTNETVLRWAIKTVGPFFTAEA